LQSSRGFCQFVSKGKGYFASRALRYFCCEVNPKLHIREHRFPKAFQNEPNLHFASDTNS
jgi:hypothetical protein